jgi:hypothetical protein
MSTEPMRIRFTSGKPLPNYGRDVPELYLAIATPGLGYRDYVIRDGGYGFPIIELHDRPERPSEAAMRLSDEVQS